MKNIQVSVIMAVFNAENYLAESIESALTQTHLNLELIICNDGSDDNSRIVLSEITDSRVIILDNDSNRGVSETRNRCLQIAKGSFIAILDSDDIWEPDKLEKQLEYFRQHPGTDIVGTQVTEIDSHGQTLGERIFPSHHKAIFDSRLWFCPFLHSSILVRREAMHKYDSETKQAEDWEVENKILLRGHGANLDERLVRYRVHDRNLTNSKNSEQRSEALRVVSKCPEIKALSPKDYTAFTCVFTHKIDNIKNPIRAILLLLRILASNGYQIESLKRLKWVLSHALKSALKISKEGHMK